MKDNKAIYEVTDYNLDNAHCLLYESLFHNANGYIGVRSLPEEGYPPGYRCIKGQYINGVYDFKKMKQAEKMYGLVEEKQTMLNVVDTQSIKLSVDGENFSMFQGEVLSSRRWVDTDKGITGRRVHWRSPNGKEVKIEIIRMASFHQLSLFTIDYSVTPVNFSGCLVFESGHDADVSNFFDPHDPRTAEYESHYLTMASCELQDGSSYITSTTSQSELEMCSGVSHSLSNEEERNFFIENENALCRLSASAHKGETIRLIKYAVFCDSIRCDDTRQQVSCELEQALAIPIEELYAEQQAFLSNYWENCDVDINGDHELNIAMRYNLFALLQSVGKDQYSNICPKGLSGEGYEGHYFWDSEMYIQPFFTITNPALSKKLIEYRYETLDMAKENATLLGHKKGALYPWRTIMGKECSGYYPAGTAQYHINGDIAHSVVWYYLATGDLAFIQVKGAEIIFETARLWMDVGHFHNGRFFINNVTGPDEYTCLVNNNYYTNVIAQYHLKWAVKLYYLLKNTGLGKATTDRIFLRKTEIDEFKRAADSMFLPYDDVLKINPQDDSFLQKKPLSLEEIPKENHPLLLYYHPLFLYRHQICKQADTVLAHFIVEDAQSEQTMRNSYEYYEKITVHDSSLSTCIFSIMAARLGKEDKAVAYFGNSAKMDLLNLHKNTEIGIHTANMGGSYMVIVYGFAGFRLNEDGICFSPMLPKGWRSYRFKICYRKTRIRIEVDAQKCVFTREHGDEYPCTLFVYDEEYFLKDTLTVER
jgi:alpha,alpha-trehalose phosphorylase